MRYLTVNLACVTALTSPVPRPCHDPRTVNPKGRVINGFRKGLFATIVAIAFPLTQADAAGSTFDGAWNVRISSSSETCGNGATVAIGINNGQIASSSAAVTASGRVADAGAINVNLSTGIKHAVGFGRLSGTSGSGTWRGAMCSGTWPAERM